LRKLSRTTRRRRHPPWRVLARYRVRSGDADRRRRRHAAPDTVFLRQSV